MSETSHSTRGVASGPQRAAIEHLRNALNSGHQWPESLLEAMALWTTSSETYCGRTYNYFIAGEAFDWLLLAERLCGAVDGLVPQPELEELLFHGRFPLSFQRSSFKSLLGVDKYRGYLNYYYGVTVEEALQLATELEVHKRHVSNGVQYRDDHSEEAYVKLYRSPRSALLERFREERGSPAKRYMGLGESNEFTYWLFKHRLEVSDGAKTASDIKKGLEQLRRMRDARRDRYESDPTPSQSSRTIAADPPTHVRGAGLR